MKAIEQRRFRAADLFRRGVIPAEIARQLGVSHQIVSEWRKAWQQGGRAALRSAGRVGRPAKLSTGQLAKVEKALAKGAEANGYVTDVWTLPRVAEVIERLTGVAYHPGYRVVHLAQALALELAAAGSEGPGARRCGHRAVGQTALAATGKRARRQHALIVFEDESGVSLLPSVRATWAPRGRTPVLRHRFGWKRLSLAVALVFEPNGSMPRAAAAGPKASTKAA